MLPKKQAADQRDETYAEEMLLEDIGLKVERLMREQRLTRARFAERLCEAGMRVSREWVENLITGKLDPEKLEMKDVATIFAALGQRVLLDFARRS